MGILDKVKNMFTVEVDEPTKKEEVKVQIEEDEEVEETPKEEQIPPIKPQEKPAPIFFDDQDFAILEKPKVKEEKRNVEERYYTKKVETTEKKVFKLSPVISPVYGVLDKNYHKEDITPKTTAPKLTYYEREKITIEEVRKKAYGTLEDELETSFIPEKKIDDELIGSRVQRKYHNDAILDDLMNPEYEPSLNQNKKDADTDDSQVLEPIALDDFLLSDKDNSLDQDYKDPLDDTLTESDLFHLIDSMYDKEEE